MNVCIDGWMDRCIIAVEEGLGVKSLNLLIRNSIYYLYTHFHVPHHVKSFDVAVDVSCCVVKY